MSAYLRWGMVSPFRWVSTQGALLLQWEAGPLWPGTENGTRCEAPLCRCAGGWTRAREEDNPCITFQHTYNSGVQGSTSCTDPVQDLQVFSLPAAGLWEIPTRFFGMRSIQHAVAGTVAITGKAHQGRHTLTWFDERSCRIAREAVASGGSGSYKYLDELITWRELSYSFAFHK